MNTAHRDAINSICEELDIAPDSLTWSRTDLLDLIVEVDKYILSEAESYCTQAAHICEVERDSVNLAKAAAEMHGPLREARLEANSARKAQARAEEAAAPLEKELEELRPLKAKLHLAKVELGGLLLDLAAREVQFAEMALGEPCP